MNSPGRILRLDLAAAAFVLCVVAGVGMIHLRPQKFADVYHLNAQTLSRALRGRVPMGSVTISRAPGPVFYYAVPYLLVPTGAGQNSYWMAGFLWNVAWTSFAGILLRRMGESMCRNGGWFALLLAFLPPLPAYYSFGILSEPPAFLGAVLFAYGWLRWLKERERPFLSVSWWISWLGLSVLVLCRPNAVLVLPIGAFVGWRLWRSSKTNRTDAVFILTGLAVPLAAIGLSVLLIRALGGGWQEGNLTHVALQGRFQFRTEPWDWRYWQRSYRSGSQDYAAWAEIQRRLRNQSQEKQIPLQDLQSRWIIRDLMSHPALSLRSVGVRILALNVAGVGSLRPKEFRMGPVRGPWAFYSFHALLNVAHLGAVILAILFLIQGRQTILRYWALWGPWLALVIFTALTYVEPRYLFPGRPGMAVLAAGQLGRLLRARARLSGIAEDGDPAGRT